MALFRLGARALKMTLFTLLGAQGAIVLSYVSLAPAILFAVSYGDMRKKRGTDKILFIPVPVLGNGTRVLPLLGHRQKALFRLVPVPENRERAPSLKSFLAALSNWNRETNRTVWLVCKALSGF